MGNVVGEAMVYHLVYMDFVSVSFVRPDIVSFTLCCGQAPDFLRKGSTGVISNSMGKMKVMLVASRLWKKHEENRRCLYR